MSIYSLQSGGIEEGRIACSECVYCGACLPEHMGRTLCSCLTEKGRSNWKLEKSLADTNVPVVGLALQ